MPSWSLFRRKDPSASSSSAKVSSKHRRSSSSFNISTMSSAGDIIKSVSEANNTESGPMPQAGGDPQQKPKLCVRRCVCCGTKLQFPDGIPYFKCSICETFHDLKPSITYAAATISGPATLPPSPPLQTCDEPVCLNLDIVKSAIEADSASESEFGGGGGKSQFPNLEKLLIRCFSSVEALNHSFPLNDEDPQRLSYSRPNINLDEVRQFYKLLINLPNEGPMVTMVNTLVGLLKRPRFVNVQTHNNSPADIYFLLIIWENPILYDYSIFSAKGENFKYGHIQPKLLELLERTIGLIAHSSKKARHYLLNWLSRYPREQYIPKVELLNAYVAHRLTLHYNARNSSSPLDKVSNTSDTKKTSSRHHSRSYSTPAVSSSNTNSLPRAKKRRSAGGSRRIKPDLYGDDWRIAAFVRVLAIFFNANTVAKSTIPISTFYNSMVDFTDVASDFDKWQRLGVPTSTLSTHHFHAHSHSSGPPGHHRHNSRDANHVKASAFNGFDFSIAHQPKVAFCQYPFLLSMGSKTQILEYDARRQMEYKAQEAFFGALDRRCSMNPYLYIRIRRENLLQDSFEAFEQHEDDFKKGLRIEFIDEPGVDAGGLKKEWFLLLIRELFDSKTGLFVEDEESHFCWFDGRSAHPLKWYKLTGIAIGLALYNSTILDINFPSVIYKKLLGCVHTLEDFTQYMPSYGRSLQYMLDYDGDDFEDVFSLSFVVTYKDKAGRVVEDPLMYNGHKIPVTKANRAEYVRKVVNYYLDTSIRRQFEAFKQGFYNVVGGNALTLFRPEEIELLIRGSPDQIDVDSLKSVTKYQHWVGPKDAADHVVVKWFWKYFAELQPEQQRKLLMFVTGSDRIPATGIANMSFKISNIGYDCDRLPTSHTCFNQLCLYEYSSRAKLEAKMNVAINNSQGFGIK